MPRIKAFSPASASARKNQFDGHGFRESPSSLLAKHRKRVQRPSVMFKEPPSEVELPKPASNVSSFGAFRVTQDDNLFLDTPIVVPQLKKGRCSIWTNGLNEISLERVSHYLSIADMVNSRRVCRSWNAAINSADSVWRSFCARTCKDSAVISRRSSSVSWKQIVQSRASMFTIAPKGTYFDLAAGSSKVLRFDPSNALVEHFLGSSAFRVFTCLEILPRLFWLDLRTPGNVRAIHTGVVLSRTGVVVQQRGLCAVKEYLEQLSGCGWKSLTFKSLMLLLTALQGFPPFFPIGACLDDTASILDLDPVSRSFLLSVQYLSSTCGTHYYFGQPRPVRDREELLLPSRLGDMNVCNKENCSPARTPDMRRAILEWNPSSSFFDWAICTLP